MSVATQSTPKSTFPPLERSGAGELVSHSLPALAVAYSLAVNPAVGLTSFEVAERRTKYGSNSIQSIRPRPAWRLLVDQFALKMHHEPKEFAVYALELGKNGLRMKEAPPQSEEETPKGTVDVGARGSALPEFEIFVPYIMYLPFRSLELSL